MIPFQFPRPLLTYLTLSMFAFSCLGALFFDISEIWNTIVDLLGFGGGSTEYFVQLNRENLTNINLVLFWTPWFASNPLSLYSNGILPPDSSQFLKPPLCYQRYPNCYFTTHRKYLNNSKVILFHWWDLQPSDLPLNRMASQAWTLYDAEPPPNLAYLSQNYPQMTFNQTATYRTDSDVVVPYARLVPGSGGQIFFDFRLKTKNVVWFVSNCNSASRREIYVKQLAKYIDVDIYGKCGTSWNCGPKASSDCYQQAARQYRFYLSFENAICRDYVTEKLFNILKYPLIPVVLGGANYSSFLPPNSYIDATNLKPETLASLLHSTGSNETAYRKYFDWKRNSHVEGDSMAILFCELCRWMQLKQGQSSDSAKTAEQINRWFFNDTACRQGAF